VEVLPLPYINLASLTAYAVISHKLYDYLYLHIVFLSLSKQTTRLFGCVYSFGFFIVVIDISAEEVTNIQKIPDLPQHDSSLTRKKTAFSPPNHHTDHKKNRARALARARARRYFSRLLFRMNGLRLKTDRTYRTDRTKARQAVTSHRTPR